MSVFASQVKWQDWKEILGKHFKYLAHVKITQQHVFIFKRQNPGYLEMKESSTSGVTKSFCLLLSPNFDDMLSVLAK